MSKKQTEKSAAPAVKYELKLAVRKAVPPLIGLWSKSGGGKTFSAFLLARGILDSIIGPGKGKIAMIDTENGRALFYSDDPEIGPWYHCDLQPPFTAEKYIDAFKDCLAQGADIIIVDSGSHVWEGEGGALDQAEAMEQAAKEKGRADPGLSKWKNPKIRHKRYSNFLTRSSIPVIFCLRAKEGIKQVKVPDPEKPGRMKTEIQNVGWVPIAEKNFVFEMTLDLHMVKDGKYDLETSKTVPKGLRGIVKEGGVVNREMGQKIGDWMKGGADVDREKIDLKRDGQNAALQGVESYTKWLASVPKDKKEKVREFHAQWTEDAKEADRIKKGEEDARAAEEKANGGKLKAKATDIDFM